MQVNNINQFNFCSVKRKFKPNYQKSSYVNTQNTEADSLEALALLGTIQAKQGIRYRRHTLKDGSKAIITYKNGKIHKVSAFKNEDTVKTYQTKTYEYDSSNNLISFFKQSNKYFKDPLQSKNGTITNAICETYREKTKNGWSSIHRDTTVDSNGKKHFSREEESRFAILKDSTVVKIQSAIFANDEKCCYAYFTMPDGIKGTIDLMENKLTEVVYPKDKNGTSVRLIRSIHNPNEIKREIITKNGRKTLETWENGKIKNAHTRTESGLSFMLKEYHNPMSMSKSDSDIHYRISATDMTINKYPPHSNYHVQKGGLNAEIKRIENIMLEKINDEVKM